MESPIIEGIRINLVPHEKYDGEIKEELLEWIEGGDIEKISFLLVLRDEVNPIGVLSMTKIPENRNAYSLSFYVSEEYRNQRYTLEAIAYLADAVYTKKAVLGKSGKPIATPKLLIIASIHDKAANAIAKELEFDRLGRMKKKGKAHNVYIHTPETYEEELIFFNLLKAEIRLGIMD